MEQSRRATDPPRVPLSPDPVRRRLTEREREVALLVRAGLKDVIIAKRLGIRPGTAGSYIRRIQYRLGLADRDALAAWVAARCDPVHPEAGLARGEDGRPS